MMIEWYQCEWCPKKSTLEMDNFYEVEVCGKKHIICSDCNYHLKLIKRV